MQGPLPAGLPHAGNGESRIDYLDGWRGLAIGLVLVAHFLPHTPWFNAGLLGVNVFFCLSGLLMSNLLFVRRVALGTFYKRRVSRILPVFLLFVAAAFTGEWLRSGHISGTELASTLLFLRSYYPTSPDIWETVVPIGHLWSLNVEEHCYLFLGLLTLVAALRRREAPVLIGAGLLSICVYVLYAKFPAWTPPWGDIGTEALASHLLLSAGYFLLRDRVAPAVRPWMPLAAFVLAVLCYTPFTPKWASALVSPFLLAFAVNHLQQVPAAARRALAWRPLCLLGVWSYSIYIWQQPLQQYQQLLPTGTALLLAVGVGVLWFHAFENPVRAWLNRHW